MNEPEGADRPDSGGMQPMMHFPDEGKPLRTKIILTVFLLLVLASVAFLVYIFFDTSGGSSTSGNRAASRAVDTAGTPAISRVDTSSRLAVPSPVHRDETPVLPSSRPSTEPAPYTIYIASYLQRSDAEEEVQRWKAAGYDSFVVEARGHFRVALGRYAGVSEARRVASDLEEAFENGYWIARVGS